MSPCGSCGGKRVGIEYVITYKGGEASETVATMAEVRLKLAASSKGGGFRAVPKTGSK